MGLNPKQIASIAEGATGLAAVIGGAIYGGVKSGKLNKQAESILKGQEKFNEDWYNIKRSSDYTQRSDVQAAFKKQREILDDYYKRAKATNTVVGGTDEALALQKQAANQSLSQTATDAAAKAAEDKDRAENTYLTRKAGLEDQERLNLQQRAAAVAQASSQVVNAGLKMVGTGAQHYSQATIGGMGGNIGNKELGEGDVPASA